MIGHTWGKFTWYIICNADAWDTWDTRMLGYIRYKDTWIHKIQGCMDTQDTRILGYIRLWDTRILGYIRYKDIWIHKIQGYNNYKDTGYREVYKYATIQ